MLEPFEPRAVCLRCRRPESVCYCRHITPLDTATRVVLLQHPRERDVAIGTARMASLCLPNSELHVGVRWQGSSALARALSDPSRPAALLYPGEGAIDVDTYRASLIKLADTYKDDAKLRAYIVELLDLSDKYRAAEMDADALLKGTHSGVDGMQASRIIEAAYESARHGKVVPA